MRWRKHIITKRKPPRYCTLAIRRSTASCANTICCKTRVVCLSYLVCASLTLTFCCRMYACGGPCVLSQTALLCCGTGFSSWGRTLWHDFCLSLLEISRSVMRRETKALSRSRRGDSERCDGESAAHHVMLREPCQRAPSSRGYRVVAFLTACRHGSRTLRERV